MDFSQWVSLLDVPFFCVVINLAIYIALWRDKFYQRATAKLRQAVAFSMLFIILDEVLNLLVSGLIPVSIQVLTAVNIIYNISGFGLALNWCAYADACFNEKTKYRLSLTLLIHAPIFISIILSIVLINKGLFFVSLGDGSYEFGTLETLWYSCEFIPITLSIIRCSSCLVKSRYKTYRDQLLPLVVFSILFLLYSLLQLVLEEVPIIGMILTASLLYFYVVGITHKISADELTSLPNRRQFLRDIEQKVHGGADFDLLMLDLNNFKAINDGFGHLEGDDALRKIADLLKAYCAVEKARVYRFGGDEFIILRNNIPRDPVVFEQNYDEFVNGLNSLLASYNQSSGKTYNLSIAIGHSEFRMDDKCSIEELIQTADERMYANKDEIKRNMLAKA